MAEVTIQGVQVELEDRYSAGAVLTGNEAAALNQLRRENIRNNTAKQVRSMLDSSLPEAEIQ